MINILISDMSIVDKRLKTPLSYPGGKSRALKKLEKFNPDFNNINEIRDCFLGGGSYPLYLSQLYPDKSVWVNDKYYLLYNFWIQLRDNSNELINQLLEIKKDNDNPDDCRFIFNLCKEYINKDISLIDKAIYFFFINKCSYSGLTECASFSSSNSIIKFTIRNINNLKYYSNIIKNWKITNLDYKELLIDNKNIFFYLDPPYNIKDNLYGKKGGLHKLFNHEEFIELCTKYKSKLLISYNKEIVGLNNSYFDLTYTMQSKGDYLKNQKGRKEVAITNYQV